jgi:hypothetical protein
MLLFKYSVEFGLCLKPDYDCRASFDLLEQTLVFFIPVAFFSILTYKLPPRIFAAWWRFAQYAIPIVFMSSLLINLGILHQTPGAWQDMLDLPLIYLMYGIFIVGSIIQIIRGCYQK